MTFSLWGETGFKSRKQSINRFRGWGGVMGLEGGGVGGHDPKSNISRFQICGGCRSSTT